MRTCPECDEGLELAEAHGKDARERAGAALEVGVYRCRGCGLLYRHSVDERFSGDIETWWRQAGEAGQWALIAKADWPTFGSMEPPRELHLRHFEWASPVLVYARLTGRCQAVPRDTLAQGTRLWQGWFIEQGAGVVGVYASAEGPVFFKDSERTVLRPEATSARLARGERNEFRLAHAELSLCHVRYDPPEGGFDSWSEDETFVDFYAWLADGVTKARWYDFYTVSDPREALWWDNDEGCAPQPDRS